MASSPAHAVVNTPSLAGGIGEALRWCAVSAVWILLAPWIAAALIAAGAHAAGALDADSAHRLAVDFAVASPEGFASGLAGFTDVWAPITMMLAFVARLPALPAWVLCHADAKLARAAAWLLALSTYVSHRSGMPPRLIVGAVGALSLAGVVALLSAMTPAGESSAAADMVAAEPHARTVSPMAAALRDANGVVRTGYARIEPLGGDSFRVTFAPRDVPVREADPRNDVLP